MMMGPRIESRLRAVSITQSELARRVGVAQGTIAHLISGRSRSSTHLHKIAEELGTSPAYLTGETDDPDPGYHPSEHLTSQERELLDLMDRLEGADRAAVLQIVRKMAGAGPTPTLHSHKTEFRGEDHI